MKKTAGVIILLVVLVLSVVFITLNISGLIFSNHSPENYHSWTKALCNETHCQDYIINCRGEEFIGQSPITGAMIAISNDWADPRNESDRNRICE
jgi:hypothetical protein